MLPPLKNIRKSREVQTAFGGYNHTEGCHDGEWFDMQNMSSDHYPVLSPREPRGKLALPDDITPLKLIYLDKLYMTAEVPTENSIYSSPGGHALFSYASSQEGEVQIVKICNLSGEQNSIVAMGAYLVLFPEKIAVNTAADPPTAEFIDNKQTANDTPIELTLAVKVNGQWIDPTQTANYSAGSTAPEDPADGQYWMDTANNTEILKQFSESTRQWVGVSSTYVKIQTTGTGIGNGFAVDDGITLTIEHALNGSHVLHDCGSDYITVVGLIPAAETIMGSIEISSVDNKQTANDTTIELTLAVKVNGQWIDPTQTAGYSTGPTAPEDPADGQYWMDTANNTEILKQFSGSTRQWVGVSSTYVKIQTTGTGIGNGFAVDDGITLTIEHALNGSHVLRDCGSDYITVVGLIPAAETILGSIEISREMPDVEHVIEWNNRLWGCHYGGGTNHIYASAQGDFKNWNAFEGTVATNSYFVPVGSRGPFTGSIVYQGHLIFFKGDCLHKIYGTDPSSFQVTTQVCEGVSEGAGESLTIVGGVLYYNSNGGLYTYDGSRPVLMQDVFGGQFQVLTTAAYHEKLFIALQQGDSRSLFVFDTIKGLWEREDALEIEAFTRSANTLFILTADGNIYTLGEGTASKSSVPWFVESGIIGRQTPDKKYVVRLNVRLTAAAGSRIRIAVEYDSSGHWESQCTMDNIWRLQSFSIPLRLRRCDHFRYRIEGEGSCKIYSISKTVQEGSDA